MLAKRKARYRVRRDRPSEWGGEGPDIVGQRLATGNPRCLVRQAGVKRRSHQGSSIFLFCPFSALRSGCKAEPRKTELVIRECFFSFFLFLFFLARCFRIPTQHAPAQLQIISHHFFCRSACFAMSVASWSIGTGPGVYLPVDSGTRSLQSSTMPVSFINTNKCHVRQAFK